MLHLAIPGAALAGDEEQFYRGKTLTLVIGYSAGGGYSSGGYSSGGGGGYGSRGGGSRGPREMFPATCSSCGQETEVPFRPTSGKPVYCSSCFAQRRA